MKQNRIPKAQLFMLGFGFAVMVGGYQNCSTSEFLMGEASDRALNSGRGNSGNSNFNPHDRDGDQLNNDDEQLRGTNPDDPDSDHDLLSDGDEVRIGTDPLLRDSDKGGVNDGVETRNGQNPKDASDDHILLGPIDEDNDGLTNDQEAAIGTDPRNPDTDGDQLLDGSEHNSTQSDPLKRDTDGGGVDDGTEVALGTDPQRAQDDRKYAIDDQDRDGLSNADEVRLGTNPVDADSDDDGLVDGAEINTIKSDPLKPDTDLGGVDDGDEYSVGTNLTDKTDDALCPSEGVWGLWRDENDDARLSANEYLGVVSPFDINKTSIEEYDYSEFSAHPAVWPVPTLNHLQFFLTRARDGLSLVFYSGAPQVSNGRQTEFKLDIDFKNGSNSERVILVDDPGAGVTEYLRATLPGQFEGSFSHGTNTDGGILGPIETSNEIWIRRLQSINIERLQFRDHWGRLYQDLPRNPNDTVLSPLASFKNYVLKSRAVRVCTP